MELQNIKEKITSLEPKKIVPITIIILILIPLVAAATLTTVDSFEFDANATATNTTLDNETELGVVTDPTLEFGEVPTQAQITKNLDVDSGQTSIAYLESTGNISDKLEYEERIHFQDQTQVEVKFNSTEPGYFEGTMQMDVETPERTGGETWINLRSRLP